MQINATNLTDQDLTIADLSGFTIGTNQTENLLQIFSQIQITNSNHLIEYISQNKILINDGQNDYSPTNAIRFISLQKHCNPVSTDGKEMIRADSRPPGFQTAFTMIDDGNGVFDGTPIFWDFSNNDEIITNDSTSIVNMPIPNGYKRKRLIRSFNDDIYVKEGTIYFSDAKKGTFLDLFIVCPEGEYYYDKNLILHLADTEIVMSHYVAHHMIFGTCNLGDELNAEACQENPIPPSYLIYADITVPDDDTISFGFASLELYRYKTTDSF